MTTKLSKKSLLIIFSILLLSLPVLLFLARQTQIFTPKASGENTLTFISSTSGFEAGNPPSTNSQNVTLKLSYSGNSSPSSTNPPVNQTGSCNACVADLNSDGTVDAQDAGLINFCATVYPSNSTYSEGCAVGDLNSDNQISTEEINCITSMEGQTCNQ